MTDPTAYRATLDALPLLAWVARPDGALEHLNHRCAEYTGRPLDDLLGWDWGWAVHPADLPETIRRWTAAVRAGSPHAIEYRLRRHDGSYRWFQVRAEPVRGADGHVVRWFGTCTDIDEAKGLVDQGRAFRSLVQRSTRGHALVGADGVVRYANPAAATLLGYDAGEAGGTDLWASVHPDERRQVSDWWAEVVPVPGQRLAARAHFVQRTGASRRVELVATNLLFDEDVRAVIVELGEVGQE